MCVLGLSARHFLLRSTLALPLLLGLSAPAAAQSVKPRRIALGYFGYSLTQPGARIGYEAAYLSRGIHELYATANVGGHGGPNIGYSLFTQFEAGYRINGAHGLFLDLRLGIGYSSWFQPETYSANGIGGPMVIAGSTTSLLTPQALGGFGIDFGRPDKPNIGLFALAGAQGRYDFAGTFTGDSIMILGLFYTLGRSRPSMATLPIPPVPPAVAPDLGDDGRGPSPAPAPIGPAEPAPPVPPMAPLSPPAAPTAPPPIEPELPSLPPPPSVPYTPPPSAG